MGLEYCKAMIKVLFRKFRIFLFSGKDCKFTKNSYPAAMKVKHLFLWGLCICISGQPSWGAATNQFFWKYIKPKPVVFQRPEKVETKKHQEKEEEGKIKLHPLPREVDFVRSYDFFSNIPKNLEYFVKNVLRFPNIPQKGKIYTSPTKLDPRGHVTTGLLNSQTNVVLKRSRYNPSPSSLADAQKKHMCFYTFMDAAKEKLQQLSSEMEDKPFSMEAVQACPTYNEIIGLANIVPIIGIAKASFPKNQNDKEIIDVLPRVRGYTLKKCTKQKLPPFDTPFGLPRNPKIAIDLALQFTNIMYTIYSFGYHYGDLHVGNIMIVRNNSSFTIKLVDLDSLHSVEKNINFNEKIKFLKTSRIFLQIFLGATNYYGLERHHRDMEQLASSEKNSPK
ncbi:MAG: hypothetical protein LBN94_03350, partial [Puniceicoccales bacterium]|nr:hypothetical protein [Puniceicoccales bacterium]